jgi:hypothetical protein
MTRRAFSIGGWAALVLGILAALAAASVVVIGALALTGRVTYPVDISRGPFSIHDEVSIPVSYGADVCQKASVRDAPAPSDCLRLFVNAGDYSGNGEVLVQDGEVRATSARLTGTVDLATTGRWDTLVAVSAARKAIGLMVISGVLLLLWRLLANSAAGDVFSARAVRYVRGIGWLLIAGVVLKAILGVVVVFTDGYSMAQYGGPFLEPYKDAGIEPAQLLLGGLILLLAEAFRHGAAVEAEQRLTV